MNRLGLASLAVVAVISGSTASSPLRAATDERSCSSGPVVDVSDVEVTWGGELSRPIRWGRAVLRIDVELRSKSSGAVLCDPDAWIEIRRIEPTRRPVDSGPVVIVDGGDGRRLHRFDWRIRDRVGDSEAGRFEIVVFAGLVPVVGIGSDDRTIAGFVPIRSTHTVVKSLAPAKNRIEQVERM